MITNNKIKANILSQITPILTKFKINPKKLYGRVFLGDTITVVFNARNGHLIEFNDVVMDYKGNLVSYGQVLLITDITFKSKYHEEGEEEDSLANLIHE